jgi:transglutaminase-like putative cysteine protease
VMLAEEIIPIMGRQENAKKVSVDLMGVSQFAWIGKEGTVLKEEGSLGIKLEQVTKEEALQKVDLLPNMDLAEIASIPVNKVLQDVDRLIELKLRLDGIGGKDIFLNGGRQSQKGKVLTIRRESIANLSPKKISERFPEEIKTYLESSLFIQSDHPEIQAKAKEIVSPDDSAVVKAYKLIAWVNKNIQKRPVVSVPNALETLRNQVGDCNEHAVLYAALARAAGIPAQVEAGLVYQNRRFYYHAWNVIYLGTWITVDPVMGQLPADVTHIRFARGTERQIDLIRMIGKVRLEILSAS